MKNQAKKTNNHESEQNSMNTPKPVLQSPNDQNTANSNRSNLNGHNYLITRVSAETMVKMPSKTETFIEASPIRILVNHFRDKSQSDD